FRVSLRYRTPFPDDWMHQKTTSSVPSGRTLTDGSPKEKPLHSVCSPDVPFWVGVAARQTSSFASIPKSVSVGRTTASHTPGSPCRRWLETNSARPSGSAARAVDCPRIPVDRVGDHVRPQSCDRAYALGWSFPPWLRCQQVPSSRPSLSSITQASAAPESAPANRNIAAWSQVPPRSSLVTTTTWLRSTRRGGSKVLYGE